MSDIVAGRPFVGKRQPKIKQNIIVLRGGGHRLTIVKLVKVEIQDMSRHKRNEWSSNHHPCSLISHIKSSQYSHNEGKSK